VIITENQLKVSIMNKFQSQLEYLTEKFNELISQKYMEDSVICNIYIPIDFPVITRQIANIFVSMLKNTGWNVESSKIMNGYLQIIITLE
jgi:hypothetical protein